MEGIQKWHPSNRSSAAPLSSFQNAASCASSRGQAQATGSSKDLAWAILEDGAALQEQQAYLYVLPTCRCPLLRCITGMSNMIEVLVPQGVPRWAEPWRVSVLVK